MQPVPIRWTTAASCWRRIRATVRCWIWRRKKPVGPAAGGRARARHRAARILGTIVAQVAEVSLAGTQPRVHRVVCAVDCGTVIHPGIVAQQAGAGALGATPPTAAHIRSSSQQDRARAQPDLRPADVRHNLES